MGQEELEEGLECWGTPSSAHKKLFHSGTHSSCSYLQKPGRGLDLSTVYHRWGEGPGTRDPPSLRNHWQVIISREDEACSSVVKAPVSCPRSCK